MVTPGRRTESNPGPHAAIRAAPPASVQVLLVVGNQLDAAVVNDILGAARHTCFHVRTVDRLQAATDILDRQSMDVVLLDLNLPDSHGVDTVRRLSAADPNIPIVVLSDALPEDRRTLILEAGAHDEIGKDELMRPPLLMRSLLYAIARHQAQQQSRCIAALVSADPDAIIVADDTGAVRFVNDAATRLFDLDRGSTVEDLLGFSVAAGQTTEINIVNGSRSSVGDMRVVRIDWMGQPAWLAAIRDTTEQKALTDQLREAQKMEALGRLAGGVAHDFNNLLMIILGAADLLGERVAADHWAVDMLGKIEQAAERAASVSRQLLAFSRRSPVRPVPLETNTALRTCIGMLEHLIGEDIDLAVSLDPQAGAVVVDPTQFDQVFMNLMVNARDAMPAGGRIEVRTRVTNVMAAQIPPGFHASAGRFVEVSVRDTGEGMSEAVQQRIFEPFFTTKPEGRGTGLGLSTSHGIVAQAGGFITVESQPTVGTTFRVCLVPAVDAPMPEPTVFHPSPSTGGTVLLVEDDDDVRLMVRTILQEAGHTVVEAGDGLAGLAACAARRGAIDLVLSDVVMPRMSGYQLAEALEAERPALPVLLMSGYPDAKAGSQAPGRMCIAKPIRRADLLRAVHDVLIQARRGTEDGASRSGHESR